MIGQPARVPSSQTSPAGGAYGSTLLRTATQATLNLPKTLPRQVEVHVSSASALKVEAAVQFVLNACRKVDPSFTRERINVVTYKTKSGVPEQPTGRHQGTQGAQTRARDPQLQAAVSKARSAGGLAFVVSIENTIAVEQVQGKKTAFDLAAIHVQLGAQKIDVWSDAVTLDAKYVEQSKLTGYDTTCGKFIAADTGLPHDDWHTGFVGETRKSIIGRALAGVRVTT